MMRRIIEVIIIYLLAQELKRKNNPNNVKKFDLLKATH